MPQPLQPLLHDLTTLCAAPTQALSAHDGSMAAEVDGQGTAQGLVHADVRVISSWALTVDGRPPEHIATDLTGEAALFTYLVRELAGSNVDRAVRLDVSRAVVPGSLSETFRLTSELTEPVRLELRLELTCDLAPMEQIRTGRHPELSASVSVPTLTGADTSGVTARVSAPGATIAPAEDDDTALVLSWPVELPPGGRQEVTWSVDVSDSGAMVVAASDAGLGVEPIVDRLAPRGSSDPRVAPLLRRALRDLNGLRMATAEAPEESFFAAGAPWFFTLFGRDSLWTSRLLLSVDVAQAGGTLRALGRLAGTVSDVDNAQDPGKIMHELRRATTEFSDMTLPPLYYGTIDATPLWICLLHDAWRSGLPEAEVVALLPVLRGALTWLTTYGDADGDGFLEYIDTSGHGLANQGWKDSGDSVRFADGRIAEGPVALCEVQGYAYEAAVGGAALLDAFDLPGGADSRAWAGRLAERFRTSFWCGSGADRYPALALDGAKQRVDSVTSNIGHLLGTGLLSADEELIVARRVTAPDLDSGLGLRTMSSDAAGYSPLSYHCGTVWPHDTAIVIAGLARSGNGRLAAGLVEGLLQAAMAFDNRLPELWSGEGRPVPYPAACRPQAWSAAAAVVAAEWVRAFG